MKRSGWDTKPADLAGGPSGQETVQSTMPSPLAEAATAATWEEAMPRYRSRSVERYGTDANWQRYEPRYRFAWEMRRAADLAGQSWSSAVTELRRRWEVLHPEDAWEGASDAIQDAWEA